jgi:hypothetical protein
MAAAIAGVGAAERETAAAFAARHLPVQRPRRRRWPLLVAAAAAAIVLAVVAVQILRPDDEPGVILGEREPVEGYTPSGSSADFSRFEWPAREAGEVCVVRVYDGTGPDPTGGTPIVTSPQIEDTTTWTPTREQLEVLAQYDSIVWEVERMPLSGRLEVSDPVPASR